MKYVNAAEKFSFVYQSNPSSDLLFVAARIYDVTTGTPVLLGSVVMDLGENGLYSGGYLAESLKSYLAILLVYTDDSYSVVDTDRAPIAETYKTVDSPSGELLLSYGAFDQAPSMDVAANIYNVTTGTPVFEDQVPMPEVYAGIYFVLYEGFVLNGYAINLAVYTDDSYTTVDTDRPFGSDSINTIEPSLIVTNDLPFILTGQNLTAVLEASC